MKKLISIYTFDTSANPKKVTFTDFTGSTFKLERLLLITNVTRNIVLYNFATLGGTISGNVLTLSSSFNTTDMDNEDKLQIFYDYPEGQALEAASTPVVLPSTQITALTPPTSVTANAGTNLNTSLLALESGNLASINTKLPNNLTVSNNRLQVNTSSRVVVSSATVTRPQRGTQTTQVSYGANTVYGGCFELPNIGSAGEGFFLLSLDVVFNITTTTLPVGFGNFVVYLFSGLPATINNNQVYSYTHPSESRGILMSLNGYPLFASLARGGGSAVAELLGINHGYTLASTQTSIWGYLVTQGGFIFPSSSSNTESATITARVTPA